jgi:hypothetical protein
MRHSTQQTMLKFFEFQYAQCCYCLHTQQEGPRDAQKFGPECRVHEKKHKRVEIWHKHPMSIQKGIVPENINESNIFNI